MNKEISYTAASSLPLKILIDGELVESIQKNKKILPRHIQLNPTNVCTRNCSWCSCSNRNKNLEMNYETIMKVMKKFKSLGTKSCTITGGGEFLAHKKANDILAGIYNLKIDIGLVTNADLIHKLKEEDLKKIIWMRISIGDGRKLKEGYWDELKELVRRGSKVDYSFSYVVADENPNYNLIKEMIDFANKNNFTHIRIVNDIFNADKLRDTIKKLREKLKKERVDDSKVIYQDRGTWTKGVKNCWISLLKPIVTADGKLAGCCGDQYKDDPPAKDYVGDFGTIDEIDEIWKKQKCYNGLKCVKCYYNNYNVLLSTLLEEIKHKNFH